MRIRQFGRIRFRVPALILQACAVALAIQSAQAQQSVPGPIRLGAIAQFPAAKAPPADTVGYTSNPRLDPIIGHFRDAVSAARPGPAAWQRLAAAGMLRHRGAREVHVAVHLNDYSDANVAALTDAGLVQALPSPATRSVEGWIDADAVDRLLALPFVRRVGVPDYGVARCVGNNCTAGDAILKASDLRAMGITGAGVKIGVLSDGATNRQTAVNSGDLPNTVTVNPALPGSGDEGTAMMEIIHDLAPGASLFFTSGAGGLPTTAEFIAGLNWLQQTQHVDVVVDDIGYFAEPYFADGAVAQAVTGLVNAGIIYCSAAGNECQVHYQGLFVDEDGAGPSNFHNFAAAGPVDNSLAVQVPPGAVLSVILQWNDPFGASGNDYDLWLIDLQSSARVGSGGADTQNGNDDPFEHVTFANMTASIRQIGIAVLNVGGLAQPRTLELFSNLPIADSNATCADSIFGHPAAVGVISCGAISANGQVEGSLAPYSSQGPSTIFFPALSVRATPFACGIDHIFTSGAGGFPRPFSGTSAAAPHVAGVVGLLIEGTNFSQTPAQIRTALAASASDRGPAGYDNAFGAGLIDAKAALDALCTKPATPTNLVSSGATVCGEVDLSWDVVLGATGYDVLRAPASDPTNTAVVTTTATTMFADMTAPVGVDQLYSVRSRSNCRFSDATTPVAGTRNATPATTTGVSATTFRTDAVVVSWTLSVGATSYHVLRAPAPASMPAGEVGHVTAPPFSDTTATPGVTYDYWVTGENTCGVSALGTPVTGSRLQSVVMGPGTGGGGTTTPPTPATPPPPPPTSPPAMTGCGVGGCGASAGSIVPLAMLSLAARKRRYRRTTARGQQR